MSGPPPYGFTYRAGSISEKAAQKRVEDNKRRKEQEKRERRQSKKRRSQSKDSLASINEEEEIDERTLLESEKKKNEKLTNELKELKIKHEGTIQQLQKMLDAQSEKFERKNYEFLKKIEKLQQEIEELRKNQGSSLDQQTQELHHKVNQLSNQLKVKEQQISKLKELLERLENSERKNSTEIQTLNALLSQKKQELNRKDGEIVKLNKKLKQKNERQIQQKSNCSAEVSKLKQQLEHAQDFCSLNESQIQKLQENIEQKEKLIVKRDNEISELREQLKYQSSRNNASKQQKDQKEDKKKTGQLNTIGGNVGLQKMMIDSKIVNCIKQQQLLIGMFPKGRRPKGFRLLFRASDYGFNVKYKMRYCGVAHTVLLVKTEYGKVIGGYTPLKWKISKEQQGSRQYDTSGESFVFSISNNHKLTLESPTKDTAVGYHNEHGPIFCKGIMILNKSKTLNKSCSLGSDPLIYVHPEYKGEDKEQWTKFDGSSNGRFYTQQWEVHRVIFEEKP